MPCKEEKRTICDQDGVGHEYYVIQLPASRGEKLKYRLLALLGNSLSKLKLTGLTDETDALSVFSEAVGTLFEKRDPDEVFSFLQSLVIDVPRDGQRINLGNFDQIYTDNMLEFYRACAFVLEVNFKRFFVELISREFKT